MNQEISLDIKKDSPNASNQGSDPGVKKQRSSNLELYRILCMVMIVAHHYVVNSGLNDEGGPLTMDLTSGNSLFLSFFGAWGKIGINCFLMITGYFMCTSKITLRKFVKLLGQIILYRWILFLIFFLAGYESLAPQRLIKLVIPVWGFTYGFSSCFIGFWLTIPFLNILIQNMTKRQHELLLVLMIGMYTLLGSIPSFTITFNYVTWFGIIYFIASYIRLYPTPLFNRTSLWGWMTLFSVVLTIASIVGMKHIYRDIGYFFVWDSNKFFSVAVAVCSFLYFKNLNIRYSRIINAFGAGTFGVLLIHADSSAMRTWLWKDLVDVVGHYSLPLGYEILYSCGVVLAIFIICNLIDQLRIATLEKWFLLWYDNKVSVKADSWIMKIIR